MSRTELTKIGIYIVLMLVIIKFVIITLNQELKEQREILSETAQTLSLKKDIYERKLINIEKSSKVPETIAYIYDKKHSYNSVRNTVLNWLIEEAEKKGLSLLNFELPEIKKGAAFSEITVTLRLQGKIKQFLDFLEIVEQADKILLIKNFEIIKSGQEYNFIVEATFFKSEI